MLNITTVETPRDYFTLQTTNLPSEVECKYGTISSGDECMVHHLDSSKRFVDRIRNNLDSNVLLTALKAGTLSTTEYDLCQGLVNILLRWRYDLHDK